MASKRHCWCDLEEWLKATTDYMGGCRLHYTCMREAGHSGPHEWTPDEDIFVRFRSSRPGDSHVGSNDSTSIGDCDEPQVMES